MTGLIYIPKREIIVPIAVPRPTLRGMFTLETVNVTDGRRRRLARFPNLITTLGADLLGNASPLTTCAVGSGNRAPALTDTALQTIVTSTNATGPAGITFGVSGATPWYGITTIQYSFPQGTATGNLAEIGVGSTSTQLFSRALILDGSGNPTTITVLSTEALYATYQLFQYSPSADVTGTVTIAGVNYAYTLRASNANNTSWAYHNGDAGGILSCSVFNGAIGTVTGSPSGTAAAQTGLANNPYSSGSYTLSGTCTWGLTAANFGGNGITAAQVYFGSGVGTRGSYQISFSNAGAGIPKDGSHILTLSFSTSWAINTP